MPKEVHNRIINEPEFLDFVSSNYEEPTPPPAKEPTNVSASLEQLDELIKRAQLIDSIKDNDLKESLKKVFSAVCTKASD